MKKFLLITLSLFLIAGCQQSNIQNQPANSPISTQTQQQNNVADTIQIPTQSQEKDPINVPTGTFYLPILMYHQIKNDNKQSPYIVSPAIFEEQLSWLKENGYHSIRYDEFYKILQGEERPPEKGVVITFDDGFRNQYENAFPLLKKYGMTGIFFIYTKAVGTRGGMTWDMLRDLLKNNMEIGSHTVTHPDLDRLTAFQVDYELTQSKKLLEKNLSIPIHYFAYPGGSYKLTVVKEVKKAGYLSAVTTVHNVFHPNNENPFLVRRIHIDNDMVSFVLFVTGQKRN